MIFLPESVLEAKTRIGEALDEETIDRETGLRQLLDLDPEDFIALYLLAGVRMEAGDAAGAAELLWRSINAQPCAWRPYLQLSGFISDQEPMSLGLAELACRKIATDDSAIEEFEEIAPSILFEKMLGSETSDRSSQITALADGIRSRRDLEPAEVSARLRPYRLIQQLQENASLDRTLVDTLVREGTTLLPLLIAVLRAWSYDLLPEHGASVAENTLALIGEIGEPAAFADVLEMATVREDDVSGPAAWALDRIASRNPDGTVRVIREILPKLDAAERIVIAERLVRHPELDPHRDLIDGLFEGLEQFDKNDRDVCFQSLVASVIAQRGRPGLDIARGLLRRFSGVLSKDSRRFCDEMLEEFSSIPVAPPPPPPPWPWTVYEICEGEADWSEDEYEEDDEYNPEPVSVAQMPGRNDPCWCGSGKKYKKCHLDADEAAPRRIQ